MSNDTEKTGTANTDSAPRSAKIYPFPLRGRMAARSCDDTSEPRYLAAASGDSWYHDAAIADERNDKR